MYKITEKVVGFYGDKSNTSVGRALRRGNKNTNLKGRINRDRAGSLWLTHSVQLYLK
jgi:hypothetical protein